MPQWLRILTVLFVDAIWAVFMAPAVYAYLVHGAAFPNPILFAIPGVTLALASGRRLSITSGGVSIDQEDRTREEKK